MEEILKFDTLSQYNAFNRNETLHPLVGVVDLSKAAPRQLKKMSYGFYVVLKEVAASSCCTSKNNASVCCTPSETKEENNGACCSQPEDGSACCDK